MIDPGASSDSDGKDLLVGESLYRQLFDSAIEGICLADRETGIILECNQAFLALTGYERSELIGRPQTMLHPAENDHSAVTRDFSLHRSEKQGEVLGELLIAKSGAIKEVEIKCSNFEYGGRKVHVAAIRDITARKRADDVLQARLRLLEFAATHSMKELLTATLDEIEALTGSTTGFFHFLEADQETLSSQNWSTNTLKNLCTASGEPRHYHLAQAGVWVDCVRERRAVIHNDYASLPHRKGMPEGHVAVVRELVVPIIRGNLIKAIVGVGNKSTDYNQADIEIVSLLGDLSWDIAERKLAEHELRESEFKFRTIADNTFDWEFWIDENGRFLYSSPSCERITGHAPAEFLADADLLVEIVAEEDRPLVIEHLRQDWRNLPPTTLTFRIRTAKGELRWLEHNCQSVFDAEGRFRGRRANNRDITERKRIEIALRKSEAMFSKTFHGSPVAMAITSIPDQRIIDVNESFERQSGYMREELVGRAASDAGIFHDLQDFERAVRILFTDGNIRGFECAFRTQWGERRQARLSAEILEIAGEPCLLTIAEDISEPHRAAEALKLSEERFRQMFDHISSGMVVYEAVNDAADFLIKEFNPAAERITRTRRAEVLGRSIIQVFPSSQEIGLFAAFQRVWRSGVPERHPTSLYRDNRLAIWVENYVYKLPTGEVVAIFDDVTERKLTETKLLESEIWHRSLIELGVSVYVVLDERRTIDYASPLVEKVFGWSPAEVLRKSIFEFLVAEDTELAARFFAELFRSPNRKRQIIARVRCKDGKIKSAEVLGVNLLDEPAVNGIVLSIHDVTKQVRARERIDALRAELAHSSRLAAMGEIVAGIVHEIAQPLAIVSTWTEIALREIRDRLAGDKREALLALMRIDSALERSGDILQRIKDFARKSEPSIAEVSILDAIVEVLPLVDPQLRLAGIALSVDADPRLPPVLADRIQVQQVLMNLILNAIEAFAAAESQDRRMEIRARIAAGALETAVSDTGCGLPPERLESIFNPFESNKSEGLGLGLSICRSIVQRHGGRIWAARNGERGTTVTFTLPIAKEKTHAAEADDLRRG